MEVERGCILLLNGELFFEKLLQIDQFPHNSLALY
jgi:hypothetical protein